MTSKSSFQVYLKKGSRTIRCVTAPNRDEANRIAQCWYQEGDGHRFEIKEQVETFDQVHPRIEPDQYLTQQQRLNPVGR